MFQLNIGAWLIDQVVLEIQPLTMDDSVYGAQTPFLRKVYPN